MKILLTLVLLCLILNSTKAQNDTIYQWTKLNTRDNIVRYKEKSEENLQINFKKSIKIKVVLLDDFVIVDPNVYFKSKSLNLFNLLQGELVNKDSDTVSVDPKYISPSYKDDIRLKIVNDKDEAKEFVFKLNSNENGPEPKEINQDLVLLPFFQYYSNGSFNNIARRDRILLIDANPNPFERSHNGLYKYGGCKKTKRKFTTSSILNVNSNISVFITNYNFNNLKSVSVNIDGTDYQYSKDILDLMTMIPDSNIMKMIGEIESEGRGSEPELKSQNYMLLDAMLSEISKKKYMNINDYMRFQSTTDSLYAALLKETLSYDEKILLSKIKSWSPQYLSLTPISNLVPDKDEVSINLKIKERNNDEVVETTTKLGEYKTAGGAVQNISSALFITGLVNNNIYTDSVVVEGSNDTITELHAFIKNETESVGVGVNYEYSFRTGTVFRPVLSAGFIVPLSEPTSLSLALGGGLTLAFEKAKFSFLGGVASGRVNKINSKYTGKDLSKIQNYSEDLTDKEFKSSWYLGFGLSFSLNE